MANDPAVIPISDKPVVQPDPATDRELIDRRTTTSRSWDVGDGQVTTELFTDPIFYRPAGEQALVPIELDFRASAKGGAIIDRSPTTVQVDPNGSGVPALTLTSPEGFEVAYTAITPAGSEVTSGPTIARGSVADVTGLLPGVDLRVSARDDGANIFLVVAAPPTEPRWTFVLDVPAGTKITADERGGLELHDSLGVLRAQIAAPYAVDSTPDELSGGGRPTTGLHYELGTAKDGRPTLTVAIDDATWLERAVYPIYVDPSVTLVEPGSNTYGDAHINAGNPGFNYANYQRPDSPYLYEMWLGMDPTNSAYVNTALVKFDISSIQGRAIDGATLQLRPYHAYYDAPTARGVWAHRIYGAVSPAWTESGVTWTNRPNWTSSFTTTTCAESGVMSCVLDVAFWTRTWLSGLNPNDGIAVDTNGNNYTYWKRLVSSENVGAGSTPHLVVTYHDPATAIAPLNAVPTNSRTLSWSFDTTDTGSTQGKYRVEVSSDNFATTLVTSGDVAGTASTWTIPGATTLVAGTTYRWAVKVQIGTSTAWSPWAYGSFVWDPTAPTGSIAYPETNRPVGGDVVITGTATDAHSFKEYQLEYGAGPTPSSWTSLGTFTTPVATTGALGSPWATGTLSGIYTLRLTVRDLAGNTFQAPLRTVVLENAARGEEEYLTRVPFELGGGYTLDVGVANGEARLSRDLFSIPSFGPPQELGLTYSSLETGTTGKFGVGWMSNLTQYLTFDVVSNIVTWHRADGGRVPFGNIAGSWTPLRGHFEVFGTGTGVYTITLKDQTKLTFEDSGGGRLTKIENRFAKALTISWTGSSATVIDPSRPTGPQTVLAFDSANNRITGATDSAGRVWSFGYTGTDLTSITDPASKVTTLAYDGSHRMTSVTRSRSRVSGSPQSVVWGIGYTSGKATSVTDPVNASVASTFTYNSTNTVVGLLKTYSPIVRSTSTFALDKLGRATSIVDPEGFTSSTTFDTDSNALTVIRPVTSGTSATTTYTYDARGNVLTDVAEIDALTTVTTASSYSLSNDRLTTSEADTDSAINLVTKFTYDGAGHLTSVNLNCTTSGTTPPTTASSCTGAGTQDAATNLISSYTYTSNDQLENATDPLGRVTHHVYDGNGNQTSVIANYVSGQSATHERNVTTSRAYAANQAGNAGLVTSTTDPLGNVTSYTYDALGRQLTETLPGDSSIPATTWTTSHDELGNTLTVTESWTPLGGGSPVSRTIGHVYDLANREASATDLAGVVSSTDYDAAGNPTSSTTNGVTTERDFDGLGRSVSDTIDGDSTTHTYDAQGLETLTTNPAGKEISRTYDLAGRLLSETVDDGGLTLTTEHEYDLLGREIETTAPDTVVSTKTYDRTGRLTSSVVGGTTTDTTFDKAGNVVTVTGQYPSGGTPGPVEKVTYDPLDRAVVRIANYISGSGDPAANLTTETYFDAGGAIVAVRDPKLITTRSILNVRGVTKEQIASCTDSGTIPTTDPRNCTGAGTKNGATNIKATSTYDGSGALVSTLRDTFGAPDVLTEQTYDGAGRLTKVVVDKGSGKLNLTTEYAYDAAGRQTAVKDPRGTVTRTLFNAAGQVERTVANCTEDTSSPQPPSSLWWTCDGSTLIDGTWNVTTAFEYDSRGNRIKETAPNGRLTTLVYDDADRLISRIDNDVASPTLQSEDITTEYAYDDAGRQVAIRLPASSGSTVSVTVYGYDALGRVVTEIRNCTVSGTSSPGAPAWKTCAGTGTADHQTNVVTTYTYDARGNRLSVTAPDPAAGATGSGTITTRYVYDADNRLCRVVEAATVDPQSLTDPCMTAISGTTTTNLSTRYTYDVAGNQISMIDALGQTTTYTYDAASRMTALTDALSKTVVWAYDDAGHRVSQENRSDPPFTNSIVWTYDAAGRMVTRLADGVTTTYVYDDSGNKLSVDDGTLQINSTYDRLNRVLTVDDEDAGTTADTSYTYSLTSPSWTDPTGTYGATLDKFDRAIALNDPVNATDFTTAYGADGQPNSIAAPNGNSTAYVYDRLGRLTSMDTTAAGPTDRALYAFTYNRAGQILTEASTITGDPANGTVSYGYDRLARLTSSNLSSTTTTYGWDKVPNRLSVQVGAGATATTTFNAANRPTGGANPTTAYSSDDDGRLTARPDQTMTWDDLGRLTAVKNAAGTVTLATYSYDPFDRLRMVDYGAGVRTRFRYVGLTSSAAQLIDDAAGTVARNLGNGWAGERLLDWTGSGSNIRIFGTNGHHDVTWLASSTGTVSQTLRYDPWGNPRASVPSGYTPFRFQGSFYDATTDLSWVVTRWYAPGLGTFISEDSLLGSPADPPSRHLYAYGSGDPVAQWDPDGRHKLVVSSAISWREVALRYYGTDAVTADLMWHNGWFGKSADNVPIGRDYSLPISIRGRSHTVYGRDDPVRLYSGYVFGPPFEGNPWRDGYRAWMPRVLTGPCPTSCLRPSPGTYVSTPSGAGSLIRSRGWQAQDFTLGWFYGDWYASVPFAHTLRVREDLYGHGSAVTAWINWGLGAYAPGSCAVDRTCARSLTANFAIFSGSLQNGIGNRSVTNRTMPYVPGGSTSFSRSFDAAPRDFGHTVVWIPRAWGRASRVSVNGFLSLADGGVSFSSYITTTSTPSYIRYPSFR